MKAEILWARYEDVEEAHKDTFRWIFGGGECTPWDDFAEFLMGDQGVYWISGKAASGKSTIMKYISEDKEQLRQLLSKWSAGLPLNVSTFFFWSGGSRAQRSQEGLFRSLLWQILRTQPNLIRTILPAQWKEFYQDAERGVNYTRLTWSLSVLSEAFNILMGHTSISRKHFLIVDGLDEYEGNHTLLAEMFKKLATSPGVKVCIASRPLVVFEKQFKALPQMRLQDITARDIERYVNSSLYQGKRLSWLKLNRPTLAQELVEEIVEHADGVFLWVKLVVQSLLEGFGNDDDLPELQARMRLLPTELTDLYSYMLALGKDSPYLIAASEMFQLRQASDAAENLLLGATPPPFGLLDLWFAMTKVPDFGLSAKISLLPEKQLRGWCIETEKNLRRKCAGLLEVSGLKLNRYTYIRYLHRTVKEYLEQRHTHEALIAATAPTIFDPHLSLLQTAVLKLKGVCTNMSWDMNELSSTLSLGLTHARLYEESRMKRSQGPNLDEVMLLDEIDRTMSKILSDFVLRTDTPWFYQYGLLQRDRYDKVANERCEDAFLALAVQTGLNQYIQIKIEGDKVGKSTIRKQGRPLLHHAIDALLKDALSVSSLSGSSLIPHLLHAGANANEVFNGSTVWHFFLIELHKLSSKTKTKGERWFGFSQITLSFIEGGADLSNPVRFDSPLNTQSVPHSNIMKPPEIIRTLFGGIPAAVDQLELRMSEMQSLQALASTRSRLNLGRVKSTFKGLIRRR